MDTPCPPPRSVSIEHLRTPSPTPNTAEGCVDDIDPTLAPNPYINLSPLNFKDVRQDPILAALAKAQSTHPPPQPTSTTPKAPPKTSTTMFSARPAPASMKTEGLGPRMTKSAALRQGLTWEEKPRRPTTADGGGKVEFGNVPGHKRANMSISIASLAAPTVMPRQTKASQLRTGQAVTSSAVKRDPIAVAAANRETAAAEKVKRRASIAIPASLSAPQIAPRGNRSSELRTGVPSGTNTTRAVHSRTHSVLGTTSANNVENNIAAHDAVKAEEKARRRASVMGTLKSLGAPSIVPRMNKSSNLRTAPAGTPGAMSPPQLPVSQSSRSIATVSNAGRPAASVKPTASSTRPLSYAGPSPNTEPSDVYPKPTRSSMLRAGLGAKVQTK